MQGHKQRSPGRRCYWYQEHASSKNKLLIEGEIKIHLSDITLIKTVIHHDFQQRNRLLLFFTCRQYSITAARPNQLCRLYMLGILAALWKSKTATNDITAKTRASKFRPAWMNFIISLLHFQVQGSL